MDDHQNRASVECGEDTINFSFSLSAISPGEVQSLVDSIVSTAENDPEGTKARAAALLTRAITGWDVTEDGQPFVAAA